VVEEEPYLLELVRYLHLNPLRAQVVPDLRRLARFPWTGHSALLGAVPGPGRTPRRSLPSSGPPPAAPGTPTTPSSPQGSPQGRRPELQGGGLLRSQGGWAAVTALRRGREAYLGDERVLGSIDFVDQLRRTVETAAPPPRAAPWTPS